ncbi:MAG: hypothetical protein A2Z20_05015 [Bdellovibrionales bacterium RBG_16_40_8]|nr:MAG: hypothetical protein A2Z20_05015 [Bdellovibrionales bacterium RBG_16_40_8]
MDALKKLFTKNLKPKQKQYEALRLIAVEGKSVVEAASKFGYSPQSVRNIKQLFLSGEIDFFPDIPRGPVGARTKPELIERVLEIRKSGKSIYDIFDELKKQGDNLPLSTIAVILSKAGMSKLERRTHLELGISLKKILLSDRAQSIDFDKLEPFKIDCPIAGAFLFLPYIIESGILDIVKKCSLPASTNIGAQQAALSILLLKLIGYERLSHIRSYDQEPGFGVFAGLTGLPKPSYMGSYSCRTSEVMLKKLQVEVMSNFVKKYPKFYQSKFINLDFHSIPHFGEESQMEKVWCGARGKSLKGANTILAQDGLSDVILYTKADILRKDETKEIKNFISYWREVKGDLNETLVFDCKLTEYKILGDLDVDKKKVKFITLRKRNAKLIAEALQIPDDQWEKTYLPIPKRKNQRFLVHENEVLLSGCKKPFRQIIIKDHGRVKPTFVITNDRELEIKQVLTVYAKRWHIENKLSELVSFFNLNALSSPLMIRIHFDIFWTTVADTIYHRFAQDLPRYEKVRASTIFRRFINFPGRVEYDGDSFTVKIRKRAHTPLILGVEKLNRPIKVPWLKNLPLKIEWTA